MKNALRAAYLIAVCALLIYAACAPMKQATKPPPEQKVLEHALV